MVSRLALVAAAAAAATSVYGYDSDYSSVDSYATTTSVYAEPAYTTSSSYGYEPASSSYYEKPAYTSSSEYAAPAYTPAASDYEPSMDNKMRKSYKKHYGDNYKKAYDAEPSYESESYEDPDMAEAAYYMKKDYQPAAEAKTCNKGDVQCCNQVQSAKSTDFSKILTSDMYSLFPNALAGSNAPVGLTCSPLIQDLSGGVQCNQQTVCCDGGHFSGLISINCIAFNPGSSATSII